MLPVLLLLLAQLPVPPLTASEPFTVVGTHAGTDTLTYDLVINGTVVDSHSVDALVGGEVRFERPNGMPEGTYDVRIHAVGSGGTTQSPTLTLPVGAQAPVDCGKGKTALRVSVTDYNRTVSIADPAGLWMAFTITGPSRVVKIQIDLFDDGTPGWEILFAPPSDGRTLLGVRVQPTVAGRWQLLMAVEDERGCKADASGTRNVRITQ